jgi:hypothetical protein
MSALTASIAPAQAHTPRLRAVTRTRAANPPKVGYAVATLIGIFAILAGQLVLSIALGNGAYAIQDLERQIAERNRDLSIVSEEIGAMQDPQTLATLAVSLGMVDDGDPAYLRLSDAQVLGSGEPALAGSTTVVAVVPGEETTDLTSVATAIVGQDVEGESLTEFAALTEDTSEVAVTATNTLEGVDSVIPVVAKQPAPAAKTFGGDLPSPSTH